MILRMNLGTLDLIPGGVLIKVAISMVILPCALAFSRSRTNSLSTPSLRLFQMKAGMMHMGVPNSRDNSTTNNKKQQSNESITTINTDSRQQRRRERFLASLPQMKFTKKDIWLGDEMDKTILKSVIPNMLNYIVVPIVSSVDTFWVGRLGVALALAGQAAANQAFFTIYLLVSFLPNIVAPSVASAYSSGNKEEARNRVKEALFLSNFLGAIGTILLVFFPQLSLNMMVLSKDAPAMEYAIPYLRIRALSMIPALVTATGCATFRGILDPVTPLKVSVAINIFNLIADPLLIFGMPFLSKYFLGEGSGPLISILIKGLGLSGAAIAITGSQTLSGLTFIKLLLQKKLVTLKGMLEIPSWKRLRPLIVGGSAVLLRQMALNIAFLTPLARAQSIDPTGVQAAAYGIVNQVYSIGTVCNIAMQSAAAALVPSARAKEGDDAARSVADRALTWGVLIGCLISTLQFIALPFVIPSFSTLPEVQEAAKVPALISCIVQLANGPLFAGEGILLGLQLFKALSWITGIGVAVIYTTLSSPLGKSLNGILLSMLIFNTYRAFAMVYHYLQLGPLARSNENIKAKES